MKQFRLILNATTAKVVTRSKCLNLNFSVNAFISLTKSKLKPLSTFRMLELEGVLRTQRLSLVLNWRFVRMDTEINIRFLVPLKMTISQLSTQSGALCNTHLFSKLAKDTWLNSQSSLSTPLTTYKKISNSISHSDWLVMPLQLLNLTSLLTYGREFQKSQRKQVYSKWTETEKIVKLNLLTLLLL